MVSVGLVENMPPLGGLGSGDRVISTEAGAVLGCSLLGSRFSWLGTSLLLVADLTFVACSFSLGVC